MKKTIQTILLVLAAFSVLLLIGCGPKTVTFVTEEEGEQITVTAEEGVGVDWCQTGANWKMTAAGEEQAQAAWVIDKLETSGEYKGLCHVVYTVKESGGEEIYMDYWFDESGENGFVEMDINGQKIKQEWHG